MLSSLTPLTRNFRELESICLRNFSEYVKPIDEDEVSAYESSKLYLRFQPHLHKIIENLSDHKIVRLKSYSENSPSFCYLIIAAYLASHNSTKTDRRFFVRNQGKIRAERRKKVVDNQIKAPKTFTFERVFSIYQALLHLSETDEKTKHTLMRHSLICQQFNQLIKSSLVRSTTSNQNISSLSKFLISDIVTMNQINELSESIELNIDAFLEKNFF